MKVIVRENYPFSTIDIFFVEEREGKTFMAKQMDMVFEEIDPSREVQGATLQVHRDIGHQFLQGLSTALNEAGYRDSTTESFKSELNATKFHLEDMRKIVFNKGE